jgi:hypothetical protein
MELRQVTSRLRLGLARFHSAQRFDLDDDEPSSKARIGSFHGLRRRNLNFPFQWTPLGAHVGSRPKLPEHCRSFRPVLDRKVGYSLEVTRIARHYRGLLLKCNGRDPQVRFSNPEL